MENTSFEAQMKKLDEMIQFFEKMIIERGFDYSELLYKLRVQRAELADTIGRK